MSEDDQNWADLAEKLNQGDQLAYLKLSRLVTGKLTSLRAYEFESEWSDLVHEVLTDLVLKVRGGKITDRSTVRALVLQMTRHKFLDRLRKRYRRDERGILPWEDSSMLLETLDSTSQESMSQRAFDLDRALAALDEKERLVVLAVHRHGMTYEEAARTTGIPLGSAKRYLRHALEKLRKTLAGEGST